MYSVVVIAVRRRRWRVEETLLFPAEPTFDMLLACASQQCIAAVHRSSGLERGERGGGFFAHVGQAAAEHTLRKHRATLR